MRKLAFSVTLATFMMTPVQAADWQSRAMDVRPGAFVGARVQLPLGGKAAARPRAALTLAPTLNRISSTGMVRTSTGEGVALNFRPHSKPTLTLAGVRADTALGLQRQGKVDGGQKLGVSKGGWIAIGVGAAVLAGAAAFYIAATDCADHEDECP